MRYWHRQKRERKGRRPVRLHFTYAPGDVIIRVALRNRPAHDIIVVPPDATAARLYSAVNEYTKALTKTELGQLSTPLSTYPQLMDVHQKASAS